MWRVSLVNVNDALRTQAVAATRETRNGQHPAVVKIPLLGQDEVVTIAVP